MKYFVLLLSLGLSLSVNAVEIQQKKVPRSTATVEVAEVMLLKNIVACVQKGKSVKEIQNCSKDFFPLAMAKKHRHRLLAWFEMPYEISYPEKCSEEEVEFLPEEMKVRTKQILCADYKKASLNKKVLFFIGEESGSLRLLNIKD